MAAVNARYDLVKDVDAGFDHKIWRLKDNQIETSDAVLPVVSESISNILIAIDTSISNKENTGDCLLGNDSNPEMRFRTQIPPATKSHALPIALKVSISGMQSPALPVGLGSESMVAYRVLPGAAQDALAN
ncbi:hypothetical protein RJT34_08549 [Clitoria ternatea]|uniref:Uncharacterized protein n=1 Tax=Clitoria ternatea TaxID=43366 RepID=A0AAN9K759_CLITE